MVDLNNPAARLDAWLRRLGNEPKDRGGYAAVCELWELNQEDPTDQQVAMQRIGVVMALGPEVRRHAEAIPKYGQMALKNYQLVETTLFNHMLLRTHTLQHILEPMAATAWTSLEQLVELLDGTAQSFSLDTGQAEPLLQGLQQLILRVQQSEGLTPEQRSVILEHLLAAQRALLDIDLVGPGRLAVATDGLMGCLLRLDWKAQQLASDPTIVAILAWVGLVADTIGITSEWHAIVSSIGGPLGLSSSPTEG